jgi:hypothetical protein
VSAAKNSFMKKIDCTMSEKNIKRRPRVDNSRIYINMKNKESYYSSSRQAEFHINNTMQ